MPGKLLAGYYPGDKRLDEAGRKLTALLNVGVRCIINLMEEYETDWAGNAFETYEETISVLAEERGIELDLLRRSIPDTSITSISQMKEILDRIDQAIEQGKTVYVHCWGGRGRTGTVVGCYLARHGIATGNVALAMIEHLRRNDPTAHDPSPENEQQRGMVCSWKEGQ